MRGGGGGFGGNKMKCKGPGVNFLIVLINNSSGKLLLFTFKIESFKNGPQASQTS